MDDVRAPGLDAVAGAGVASAADAGDRGDASARRDQARSTPDAAAGQAWLDQNQAALEAFDRWYQENGSPLDSYRTF